MRKLDESTSADNLFVIDTNDNWVHVYPSVSSMLKAHDMPIDPPGALEFFDLHGHRLAPVFGAYGL
jgi:hypothetical protein